MEKVKFRASKVMKEVRIGNSLRSPRAKVL